MQHGEKMGDVNQALNLGNDERLAEKNEEQIP